MTGRTDAGAAVPAAATRAAEIMTAPVVTVAVDRSTGEVAEVLRRHQISGVPVVDGTGAVVGLVSGYDLLAKTGPAARDVMTTAVVSITEDTSVEEVRHLLVERRIGRVPVLAGGRLVGIVSRSDLVALLATEWVCEVCGEPVRGERPPEACPRCLGVGGRFALQEQPPGN